MMYGGFAEPRAWDEVPDGPSGMTFYQRDFGDFYVELWKQSNGFWRWAVTRKKHAPASEKSIYPSSIYRSLDATMSNCYDMLMKMEWLSR